MRISYAMYRLLTLHTRTHRVAGVWRTGPGVVPSIVGLQNMGLVEAHPHYHIELGALDASLTRDGPELLDEDRINAYR